MAYLVPITILFQTVGVALIAAALAPAPGLAVFITATAAQGCYVLSEKKSALESDTVKSEIKMIKEKLANLDLALGFRN